MAWVATWFVVDAPEVRHDDGMLDELCEEVARGRGRRRRLEPLEAIGMGEQRCSERAVRGVYGSDQRIRFVVVGRHYHLAARDISPQVICPAEGHAVLGRQH